MFGTGVDETGTVTLTTGEDQDNKQSDSNGSSIFENETDTDVWDMIQDVYVTNLTINSGVTLRTRGFRFTETSQNVNAADIHFSNGGGQFFNSTSSDNPTVTGFKFAPHTGNWAQGEITVYGYNI